MSIFETGPWFGLGLRDTELEPDVNPGYGRVRVLVGTTLSFTHVFQDGGPDLWQPFDRLLVFDAPTGGNLLWEVQLVFEPRDLDGTVVGACLHASDTATIRLPPLDCLEDDPLALEDNPEIAAPMEDRGFGV
jgi:hypothetical protein